MSSFEILQWVVATGHFLAGVSIVVLSFRGLEEHPLLGLCLGGGVAGGVIYLDLLIGDALDPAVVALGWTQIEQLITIAAATAALGVAMTALSLRPEREPAGASDQTIDAADDQLTRFND